MSTTLTPNDEAQLLQTIEMFEVITQSQPHDYQSLEILKEAYSKLDRQKDVVNTSKRIAQAYFQMGQLSSAILEYESILQRFPNDPDVKTALAEIEKKANSFTTAAPVFETSFISKKAKGKTAGETSREIDDGRQTMQKIFVDSKAIALGDFNMYWHTPNLGEAPTQVSESFIQILADKGILPLDRSLKLICDSSRLCYLPLDKYDVDMELARGFPRDICQRWCLLPFDRLSKSVLVATTNPFNKAAAQELEKATKNRVLWYIAPPMELSKTIKRVFR